MQGRLIRHGVGVHAPAAGGLAKAALGYVDATASGSVQVFLGNPRGWSLSAGDRAQDDAFASGCADRGIQAFVHAPLLVNLGSPTPATVEKSVAALEHGLRRGGEIAAAGVVFHAGSSVDEAYADQAWKQVREALLPLLDAAEAAGGPRLLVEPSAGGGRSLAARVEDLAGFFAAVDDHPWLGVCFDTCHALAAGHDLTVPGGMTVTMDALVTTVGAGRLRLIHANDSKDPVGSTRDRHETIGAGTIGLAPFGELLAHPAAQGIPVIVETPGDNHAPDVAALAALRP